MILQSRSIVRQAGLRLLISLGLFVVLLGVTSHTLYSLALEQSARERAESMETFYRARLMQVDREWELKTRDFKVRMEETRLLEKPTLDTTGLQAFMTIQGANQQFAYLHIQNRSGEPLFAFGADLGLARIPLPLAQDNGWYFEPRSGHLYRVFMVPIWLGERGTGRIALFFQLDNALLFNLATPGITLEIEHAGQRIASSSGQSAPPTEEQEDAQIRSVPWAFASNADDVPHGEAHDATNNATNNTTQAPVLLKIHAPISVLFTTTELALAAAAIPIVDALILWLTLGVWLMRNVLRIKSLSSAVEEFSTHAQPGESFSEHLKNARSGLQDEIGDVAGAIESMATQSAQREQERLAEDAEHRLWSMVFSNINEAVLISDRNNDIVAVNAAFAHLTGYSEADVLGRNPRLLASGHANQAFYAAMWHSLNTQDKWSGELENRHKDGSVFPILLSISVVRDAEGRAINYVATYVDISQQKINEAKLSYLANHDALTGLPNRYLLLDRLQGAIKLSERTGQQTGLLFLDLDGFKWVNDTLGHASGDALLKTVAQRLLASVRAADTVARLGGDEFVVVLTQTANSHELAITAAQIIEAVAQPVTLAGQHFNVTTSIGSSRYPEDGLDAETLIKRADIAMYAAKAAGKNKHCPFTAGMMSDG